MPIDLIIILIASLVCSLTFIAENLSETPTTAHKFRKLNQYAVCFTFAYICTCFAKLIIQRF